MTDEANVDEYRNREVYHWRAVYDDGTSLGEFEHDPTGDTFQNVDIRRCVHVWLEPRRPDLPAHAVCVDVRAGQRAIFFRRRYLVENADAAQFGLLTMHVIGVQETVNGRNVAVYTFVQPDGRVTVTTNRNQF